MAERYQVGVLDTCTFIDLAGLDPSALPVRPALTAVTMAELQQGVAMAKDPVARASRVERLAEAVSAFDPLPFDGDAAARYGTLVSLTIAAARDPRPRRLDLMIAAIASTAGLPLFTRNAGDFKGLDSTLTVVPV
ncbi:type II toxin-antitoxin system VapC family toxin [Streptomyces luteolus]|uniref:Type II toxin-antitoxin system VapC family toxin n=1 Tax=Streptomyces luteolus TaxID=3043615 RepID=A0ABT6T2H7_9ACTN|nr:type II toxin-antitoxin system VapC family toxin [Streptomyces sp. B-S-A12]MDI3422077.1 type II toxin-antitoxin system VapC family toxin [Streptomyces sp. B-S-A12]